MPNTQTTAGPDSLRLPLGRGGVTIAGILNAVASLRLSFIYERLSARTRAPERTYVGFGRRARLDPVPGSDPFKELRDRLAEQAVTSRSAKIFAFLSYEAITGADPILDDEEDTPSAMFLEPDALIELDHVAASATLIGNYHALVDAIRSAVIGSEPAPNEGIESGAEYDTDIGWQINPNERDYVDASRAVQTRMRKHREIAGVALSVRFEARAFVDALDAFRVLRTINPSPRMFFVESPALSLWGANSLPVLKVDRGHLTAETDGATHRVDARSAEPWIPTAKENKEYDLVVAALREDLQGVIVPQSLSFIADREPRRYFNLAHLFAEVCGVMKAGVDAVEALQRLSPHGAATGYSKSGAIQLIRQFDLPPRGPYAGVVGVFGTDGDADAACVIRSAWTVGDTVYTRAGAKIVADSDPGAEYRESVLKTLPLRQSIGILLSRAHSDSSRRVG